ncbi:isochorismatase family protein [bacterium]|nr:isochorismatase family protein [bacterium]
MRNLIAFLTTLLLCCWLLPAKAQPSPLKVCLVSGSAEYDSDTSLAAFQKYLEQGYNARGTLIKARGFEELPGLEALDDCHVALFFTRRLTIGGEQLERVKKYCLSGRPIVAVRTASHGFQKWLEFDKLVLGGNYHGHFGQGSTMAVAIHPRAKTHPVLDGIVPIRSRASLYKTAPLTEDCNLLMSGSTPESKGSQPVTWTRLHKGARVFYTSLGAQQDFENATFLRMLANALFWASEREIERKALPPVPHRPRPEGKLRLRLRSRVETFKGSGEWDEVIVEKEFPVAETAILICDMWDKHWCRGATRRCEAIAKKMGPVINAARATGVQIIHCPSDTLHFYADSPQRRRMILAPPVPLPKSLPLPSHPLPIDASDGGCDTGDKSYTAWTRQNPNIEIGKYDGISHDGKEVYYFLKQLGIKNLIIMGVHTNMCVLGRSFAIRQMTRWGIRCILVRDLTDTMYDPEDPPHVTHDEGTQLVVKHIEKYWGPSILSSELVRGLP